MANSIWGAKFQRQISELLRAHTIKEAKARGSTKEQIAKELEVFDAFADLRIKIGQDILKNG